MTKSKFQIKFKIQNPKIKTLDFELWIYFDI